MAAKGEVLPNIGLARTRRAARVGITSHQPWSHWLNSQSPAGWSTSAAEAPVRLVCSQYHPLVTPLHGQHTDLQCLVRRGLVFKRIWLSQIVQFIRGGLDDRLAKHAYLKSFKLSFARFMASGGSSSVAGCGSLAAFPTLATSWSSGAGSTATELPIFVFTTRTDVLENTPLVG